MRRYVALVADRRALRHDSNEVWHTDSLSASMLSSGVAGHRVVQRSRRMRPRSSCALRAMPVRVLAPESLALIRRRAASRRNARGQVTARRCFLSPHRQARCDYGGDRPGRCLTGAISASDQARPGGWPSIRQSNFLRHGAAERTVSTIRRNSANPIRVSRAAPARTRLAAALSHAGR